MTESSHTLSELAKLYLISCQVEGRSSNTVRAYRETLELFERAVIMTTNLPFSEWTQVIPNPRLCKALLDRITDRAHIIETGTESYRFRRTLEKRRVKRVAS